MATALLSSAALLMSCGGDGGSDEVVYLYVFNAYAGSSGMSLYGPSGTIVTGLGFGERTDKPIAVDRNLGTNFTLVIDGSPSAVELEQPLFSMYPHETGTLMLKRRSSVDAAETILYRHVPSISNGCRLVFDNALSTASEGLAQYAFVPGFELSLAAAGYDDSAAGIPAQYRRDNLMNAIRQNPYFFLAADDEQGLLKSVWVGPEPNDFPNVDYESGSVRVAAPSAEYAECLGDEPDAQTAAECARPQSYTVHTFKPDDAGDVYVIHYSLGSRGTPNACDATFRIYSDFANIFSDGKRIEDKVSFSGGDHQFWILYGRPDAPRIEKWKEVPRVDPPNYPGE